MIDGQVSVVRVNLETMFRVDNYLVFPKHAKALRDTVPYVRYRRITSCHIAQPEVFCHVYSNNTSVCKVSYLGTSR